MDAVVTVIRIDRSPDMDALSSRASGRRRSAARTRTKPEYLRKQRSNENVVAH